MSKRYFGGLAAEDIAGRHYQAKGGEILATRWRCPEGEIDLICRDGDALVFVEVKLRRNHAQAGEAISARQWQRVAAAAQAYISAEGLGLDTDMRFDAALVDAGGALQVIENAAIFE